MIANANSACLFMGYSSLTQISFGDSFDTSDVSSMYCMFSFCDRLTSLDISGFTTRYVTDMNHMFASADQLLVLDLSSFETILVDDYDATFHETNADLRIITRSDAVITQGLDVGSRGEDVKQLQRKPISAGYLSGSADGVCGNQTEASVSKAQESLNLVYDVEAEDYTASGAADITTQFAILSRY